MACWKHCSFVHCHPFFPCCSASGQFPKREYKYTYISCLHKIGRGVGQSVQLPSDSGSGEGEVVELEGSFDNWQTRQRMQRSGKDFTLVKLLPPGVYQVHCYSCCSLYFLIYVKDARERMISYCSHASGTSFKPPELRMDSGKLPSI